jgi:hypothetical protein
MGCLSRGTGEQGSATAPFSCICTEESDAGGVGRYSVVMAGLKSSSKLFSEVGVSGALVMSIYPSFQLACFVTFALMSRRISFSLSTWTSSSSCKSSPDCPLGRGGIRSWGAAGRLIPDTSTVFFLGCYLVSNVVCTEVAEESHLLVDEVLIIILDTQLPFHFLDLGTLNEYLSFHGKHFFSGHFTLSY